MLTENDLNILREKSTEWYICNVIKCMCFKESPLKLYISRFICVEKFIAEGLGQCV